MNSRANEIIREYESDRRQLELAIAKQLLANALFGAMLAEGSGNIYWQRQFRNSFDGVARRLEESGDPNLGNLAKQYRRRLDESNVSRRKAEELNRLYWMAG